MVEAIIFYMLAGIILLSGTAVILSRNPVHSVLWLILAFFNAAGLFLITLIGARRAFSPIFRPTLEDRD